MKPINVGLLGIGTVGGGTFTVLKRNAEEIARRAGRPIQITVVADKNLELAKAVTAGACRLTDDAFSVVAAPEIDIVVELIGGCGIAKELALKAIENGKHVVTANKALLASHGNEIFAAAQKKGVMVAFEAAVAGGISDHQGIARRSDGQPHRVDRRHHQRNHQLHSLRDARQGTLFRNRSPGGATPGLCGSGPDL